jgi:hypothetical protein
MPRTYTITEAGGKPDSGDLVGLMIEEFDHGFQLVDPQNGRQLSPSHRVNIAGAPLYTFELKNFKGWDWTLSVELASIKEMHGQWTNTNNKSPDQESDSWTASGIGAGTEPGEDEARAASAKC